MRAVEHYQRAEDMLAAVVDQYGAISQAEHTDVILAAQAHAALALAGATALQAYSSGDEDELDEWQAAAGGAG